MTEWRGVRRLATHHLGLIAVAIVGAALRAHAALTMGTHFDEPASVLALNQLARSGTVRLPSGAPYLQGFGLSVLSTPMVWLGIGGIDDLTALRMISVLAGAAAVLLAGITATVLTERRWVGVVAAVLLAVDPLSIRWGGHFRMYALVQAITIGLILVASLSLRHGITHRRLALLVALSWFGVFTHIQAAIVVGPVALAVLIAAQRRWVPTVRLRTAIAGTAAMVAAPVGLVLANRVLGSGSSGTESTVGGAPFVGSNWVRLDSWDRFAWGPWWDVVSAGPGGSAVPVLVVIGTLVLAAAAVVRRAPALAMLIATHWIAVFAIAAIQTTATPRYTMFVLPLSFAIAACGIGLAFAAIPDQIGLRTPVRYAGAALIAGASFVAASQAWRAAGELQSQSPEFLAAARRIAEERRPGERVLVTLPTGPAQVLGTEDMHFLSGRPDGGRFALYTRPGPEGGPVDYWMGIPAASSAAQLCELLLDPAGAWVLVPDHNLRDQHWFALDQQEAIDRLTVGAGRLDSLMELRRTATPTTEDRAWCDGLAPSP